MPSQVVNKSILNVVSSKVVVIVVPKDNPSYFARFIVAGGIIDIDRYFGSGKRL